MYSNTFIAKQLHYCSSQKLNGATYPEFCRQLKLRLGITKKLLYSKKEVIQLGKVALYCAPNSCSRRTPLYVCRFSHDNSELQTIKCQKEGKSYLITEETQEVLQGGNHFRLRNW